MKRLTKLDTEEVSLVPRGANKRKFLILKSGEKMSRADLLKMIKNADPKVMGQIDKIIKAYNEECMEKAELTTEGRKHIAGHDFAEPKERKYPINDESHARNALARASGKPEEGKVRAAVHRKYPDMGKDVSKDNDQIDHEEGLSPETPLDERAQAAMKASARILSPFKGKIPAALVHKLVDETLGDPNEGEDMEKSSRQSPEEILDEHKVQAMKAAKSAYGAELKKLGYTKYNDSQEIAQKDVEGVHGVVTDDEAEEEEQEGTMHDPDVEKGKVMKSLEASIGQLPKEQKKVLSPIFKALQSAVAEADTLRKEVTDLRHRELRRDFVKKASSYKTIAANPDELADMLMEISTKAPAVLEKVEKLLSSADEAASKGGLFGEIGSSLPNNELKGNEAGYDKIVQAAMSLVQKSGEKLSREDAIDRFLDTPEGKKMYREYTKTQMAQRS